jgi:hypothetical protein
MADKEVLPLRYILVEILRDAAVVFVTVGMTFAAHLLVRFIAQGEVTRRLEFVTRLMVLAVLVLFVLTSTFRVIYGLHVSIRQALESVQSAQQPPSRKGNRVDLLSLLAGFLGLVFVFGLLYQATSITDPVSKLLIYTAAFILGFEVILMVAHKAKNWTIGSILSATHHASGRSYG